MLALASSTVNEKMLTSLTPLCRRTLTASSPHLCRRTLTTATTTTSPHEIVTVESHGNVAVINFDDSKMNAFSFLALKQWNKALDVAENADSVVIFGNKKAFSAGFDLAIMGNGPSDQAAEMLKQGGELCCRLAAFPRPTILGATGHSLALGAIMTFCCDYRVVINECVELAKIFGATDSHKYVNGVLDKLASELRPAELLR